MQPSHFKKLGNPSFFLYIHSNYAILDIEAPPGWGWEVVVKKEALKYMKMAQGQLNGAIKMAEDNRYCIDVSHQILASISLLKKANESMLKEHMNNCLVEAFETGNQEEKFEEVIQLIHKMID